MLRIVTDDGAVGEAYHEWSGAVLVNLVDRVSAEALVGQRADYREWIWRRRTLAQRAGEDARLGGQRGELGADQALPVGPEIGEPDHEDQEGCDIEEEDAPRERGEDTEAPRALAQEAHECGRGAARPRLHARPRLGHFGRPRSLLGSCVERHGLVLRFRRLIPDHGVGTATHHEDSVVFRTPRVRDEPSESEH